MPETKEINDYESEPVFYCTTCLSLNIKHEDSIDTDCCGECGCTTVGEAPFEVWERKYEKRYGHKLTEKSNNIRNSPIFNMSLSKLMKKVSDYPRWDSIIRDIYGFIPKGLNKADAIVLFFDRLVKDNKMDKLKELLYKLKV